MTHSDHDQHTGLDAPLDVERDSSPQDGTRVDAERVEGNVPTGDDESLIDKLLRVGTDAPDAADIEDPDQQL